MARQAAKTAKLQARRSAATAKKRLEKGKKYGVSQIQSALGQDVDCGALITEGVLTQVEGGMYMLA